MTAQSVFLDRRPAPRRRRAATIVGALALVPLCAWPHGFAGKRFFPSTLAIEDPFVNDEFSLIVAHIKEPGEGDEPPTLATEIEAEYAKTIFPNFAISLGGSYNHLDPDGEEDDRNGPGNLEVGAKYQVFTSPYHEALLAIGLEAEVGGTGDRDAEADEHVTISPALFFGKGLGDLPESLWYVRPFALTGFFGGNVPTEGRTVVLAVGEDGEVEEEIEDNPTTLGWGFTVQYNLNYLESHVRDVGLPAPLDRMVPLVELALETCISDDCDGETAGTVNPGIIWLGKYIQLGIEAQIPLNDRTSDNVGFLAQFHVFVDDLMPSSLGRPIFGQKTHRPSWQVR